MRGSGAEVAYDGVGWLLWNRVTMDTQEGRLEQLERSLQQAGTALQASELQDCDSGDSGRCCNNSSCDENSICLDGRHARARGNPLNFAGDEASWKSWSFVRLSFSAAVSPELRALIDEARTAADET